MSPTGAGLSSLPVLRAARRYHRGRTRYLDVWEMFHCGNGEIHVPGESGIVCCAPGDELYHFSQTMTLFPAERYGDEGYVILRDGVQIGNIFWVADTQSKTAWPRATAAPARRNAFWYNQTRSGGPVR